MPITKSVDLDVISEKTHHFTGADLQSLCRESALIAARRSAQTIEMQDFNAGMELVTPTINDEMEEFYSKN